MVKPNFVHPDPGVGDHRGDYALYLGPLTAEKGAQTLLEAWHHLPEIQLKVGGDGPLRPAFDDATRRRSLSIELLGQRPQLRTRSNWSATRAC